MAGRQTRIGSIAAGLIAALLLLVGCDTGGGGTEPTPQGDGEATGPADTGPDVAALRAAWAEEIGVACTARNEAYASAAKNYPLAVQTSGFTEAAEPFAEIEDALASAQGTVEPAPGDEARVQEMTDLYGEAGQLGVDGLRAKYMKEDRAFYELMDESAEARQAADEIATELGADDCAVPASGPYVGVDALAAVRWAHRASAICSARDRAYSRLRPTDTAGFDRARRRWLAQMRALSAPQPYTPRIKRIIADEVASERAFAAADAAYQRGDVATGQPLVDKGNRLTGRSIDRLYEVGLEIGYPDFCSS